MKERKGFKIEVGPIEHGFDPVPDIGMPCLMCTCGIGFVSGNWESVGMYFDEHLGKQLLGEPRKKTVREK